MDRLSIWDVLIRIAIAVLCGGIIGIDRGRKRRPAGFRTYMLVCAGAAMTMVLGEYLAVMLNNVWLPELMQNPEFAARFEGIKISTDVSRFGAQVINGIGFLGAGTIIVTGRQQVKGMTTAAGLWASACMGLCIGAGFYLASLICCGLIALTIVVFSRLERFILARTRDINVFVELEHLDQLSAVIEKIKKNNTQIFDVEITKGKLTEKQYPSAIFTLRLPKKMSHTAVMTAIAEVEAVRSIEEL